MKAYLGIVLGNRQEKMGDMTLNLPTNIEGIIGNRNEKYDLEQLDSYIARNYNNGEEIRNDPRYKEKIDFFLGINEHFINKFKSNKKGSIVIIIEDEMRRERRLRVLYNKDLIKTVPKYMLGRISDEMNKLNLNDVLAIYNDNKRLFFRIDGIDETPIENIENCIKYYEDNKDADKDMLKNVITYNMMQHLDNMLDSKVRQIHSDGYLYVRLIDSYLKKEFKIETTKVDKVKKYELHSKNGDLRVYGVPKVKAKLEKNQIDGQLSLDFGQDDNSKKLEKK